MLTYLRYALATFCFAASVGCLALWWRSESKRDQAEGPSYIVSARGIGLASAMGVCTARILPSKPAGPINWQYATGRIAESERVFKKRFVETNGYFSSRTYGGDGVAAYFPLWYPALVFALAGIASLRLGRRFTLRSAIIATTVVAGLLGMAVAL